MNKVELKTVEAMLGYAPNDAMQILLLEAVRGGNTMQEAIAQYVLPEMAIVNRDGKFHDIKTGRRITPEEWHEMSPLGPYAKLIIVREKDI